jgi:hypothetical protein
LGDVFWCVDLKEIEHTQELKLGNVTILGAVKVLEDWLQVHAANSNSTTVFIQNSCKLLLIGMS